MSGLPSNVSLWKNQHFIEYCTKNPKFECLLDFIRKNSIDGAFFFTVSREDFANIEPEEISPEGIELFFELQDDLKVLLQQKPNQTNVGHADQELVNEEIEENPTLPPLSLVLIDNQNNKKQFLQNEIKLGRDNQSHIYYDDKSISRSHANIIRVGNSFHVRDESSSNGTFIKLFANHSYALVPNMVLDIPKIAELLVTFVGLMQVKIKVTSENEDESNKEFNLNLWGQQNWVVGRENNQVVCELVDNATQNFDMTFFEVKQLGNKNVIKVSNPNGIWSKIGSKELKEVFKFYPLKKSDVLRIGDNIELEVSPESTFEDFSHEYCELCKIQYSESVEFVNLDCKHIAVCRVCRFTELLCPVCSRPVKSWEPVSNVVAIEEHDG